jgi:uncharacterized protein YciI
MFIINLTYIVPLEELNQHMAEHVRHLEKYYDKNIFVAWGRKEPRTGGIILALAAGKTVIEEIIKKDPFYTRQLADFDITEFLPTTYHPDLKSLLG